MKRTYDSTVARIAGNLLSGGDWKRNPTEQTSGPIEWRVNTARIALAVEAARAIVDEVQRTEWEER